MAGSVSLGRSGRNSRKQRYAPMAEINVTPFVDVMLVLLIIFMVSAPLLTAGVPIDLPETAAKILSGDDEPITITLNKAGKWFLQETELPAGELLPKLTAIAANRRGLDERVFVRADKGAVYGEVMKVMGALNAAGYRRIALVTDTDTGS